MLRGARGKHLVQGSTNRLDVCPVHLTSSCELSPSVYDEHSGDIDSADVCTIEHQLHRYDG